MRSDRSSVWHVRAPSFQGKNQDRPVAHPRSQSAARGGRFLYQRPQPSARAPPHHSDHLGLLEGDERISVAVVYLRPAVVALARGDDKFRDIAWHSGDNMPLRRRANARRLLPDRAGWLTMARWQVVSRLLWSMGSVRVPCAEISSRYFTMPAVSTPPRCRRSPA